MIQKFKALVYILVLSALVYLGCRVYRLLSRFDAPKPPSSVSWLTPTEQEKFMVTQNHVTTVKRDAKGQTQVSTEYVPNRAVITLNKDGSVSVKNQKFGLMYEPGLGFGYGDGFRIVPNIKLLYFYRLGLNTGVSMLLSKQPDPRLLIALSYAAIGNTSIFLGVDNRHSVTGGVSVRF